MVGNDLLKSLYMAYIIKSHQNRRPLLTVDVMSNLLLVLTSYTTKKDLFLCETLLRFIVSTNFLVFFILSLPLQYY